MSYEEFLDLFEDVQDQNCPFSGLEMCDLDLDDLYDEVKDLERDEAEDRVTDYVVYLAERRS